MDFDVSVVIRARNAEATLHDTVQSVLSQTGCTVQAAVVDDCSTDSTARVAAELSLEEPERLRVVSHASRLGSLESYRSGIRASRGQWVLLMDAGDQLAPGSLARLLEAAHEAQADMVATSLAYVARIDPHGAEPPAEKDKPQGADAAASSDAPVFSDQATGAQPRVVSPLLQTLEGPQIARALFRERSVPVSLKGRLFSADLVAHAFAEIEQDRLAEHDEAAATFIIATMAERLAVRPDLRSLTILEEEPGRRLDVGQFAAICSNRTTAEVVVDYLNRTEQWEAFYEDWEGLAVMLCAEAVRRFPEALAPHDWGDGADALLASWGAPYVSAAAEQSGADLALLAMGLGAAPSLRSPAGRPEHVCVLVTRQDDPAAAVRLYDALSMRRVTCTFVAEEGVALPASLSLSATLAPDAGVLARSRALGEALQKAEADALVLFAHEGTGAHDELCARALGLSVALVATDGADDAMGYCDLTAQAALASCVLPKDGMDAELWGLLGARVASPETVVATLALGSASKDRDDLRLLLSRAVTWARDQDACLRRLREQAAEAVQSHDLLTAECDDLRRQVALLQDRLQKVTAERDELEEHAQQLANAGLFQRVFRHKG